MILCVLLIGILINGGSSLTDSSYKIHHNSNSNSNNNEEGRSSSSFTPTNTNPIHSLTRPLSSSYAQSRDSYSNAVPVVSQGGVSGSQGGVGVSGSSSYGTPGTGGGGYGGGGGPGQGQQSTTYYYYHYPAGGHGHGQGGGGGGYGGGYGDVSGYDDVDDLGIGGGLGGLAGLLGLKGLKGLGLGGVGLLALLKLLKKLLLPLLLPFLLLLPLLLLFIPIPVITIPAGRREINNQNTNLGIGSFIAQRAYQSAQIAQKVFTSEMCVERIACELSTRTHGTVFDKLLTQFFEKTESMSSKKWKRGMRAYIDSGFRREIQNNSTTTTTEEGCLKYSCDLYKEFTTKFEDGFKNTTTINPSPGINEIQT